MTVTRSRKISSLLNASNKVGADYLDIFDSDQVTGLVDSAYIQLRDRFQDDSTFVTDIIDSAYILARAGEGGVDSAAITNLSNSLVDSDYIHSKGFIRSTAERRFDIKSTTPIIHSHYSVGDFWLDRDDLILYELGIDSNWTSAFPAGTASAFSGLNFFNFIGHNYAPSNYTASITNGPNGVFQSTIATGGTTGNNTGCLITFSSPTNFSYFYIGNTVSGWVYKVNYEDGSYAISNNNPSIRPSTITWYSSAGVALGKSFGVPNSGAQLQDWVHPQGKLTTSLVIGRGTYGTQNYNAWLFFAGQNTFQRTAQIFDPLSISLNLVPSVDSTYDLGSSTKKWKDLYLSGNTINLGGARISAVAGGGISITDSAGTPTAISGSNIATNVVDSGVVNTLTQSLIDSSYVQLRQSGGAITVQDEGSSLATSATTLNFTGSGVTASGTGATKTITISGGGGGGGDGLDSAAVLDLIGDSNSTRSFTYVFTASDGQTEFTGTDDNGGSLAYGVGNIITFLNGIMLIDSADYTATNGSSITLNSAANASDILSVTKFTSATSGSALSHTQYKYTTSTPATTFTGSDDNSNTLSYDAGELQVHLNGILLVDSDDYTATNGTSVVLTSATDSDDVVLISVYTGGTSSGGGGSGSADSATILAVAGELKGGMFRINPQSLTINTTIDSNENAHCAGPISFDSGVVLTINGNLVIS